MQKKHNGNKVRRIVDICMTALLIFLMAYQVTGEALHEWIGVGMTLLVIVHQILNRKWYSAVFKGKYNPYRIITTAVTAIFCIFAGIGSFLFLHSGWTDYMFFRAIFAFLDYEKAEVLVLLENLLMLVFWVFIGDRMAAICRKTPPVSDDSCA